MVHFNPSLSKHCNSIITIFFFFICRALLVDLPVHITCHNFHKKHSKERLSSYSLGYLRFLQLFGLALFAQVQTYFSVLFITRRSE